MKRFWHLATLLTALDLVWPCPAAEQIIARKLYVANTSGETLSVIDLDRQVVVREVPIGRHPHGLALSPDQRRIYCSVEGDRSVRFLDTASDEVVATVPTLGVPNQLAATPDGHWVYVAINDKGTADIIDVRQGRVVKTLDIGPRAHNCYCPRGAKHMYVTSIGDHLVKQFDFAQDHSLTQTVRFDGAVRPLCVTQDEKWLFVALEGLHVEQRLELLHEIRDRGLALVQPLGRLRVAARVDHGNQRLPLLEADPRRHIDGIDNNGRYFALFYR